MSFKVVTGRSLPPGSTDRTFFSRGELGKILPVYGRMVAAGQCRDYGISGLRDMAVFSIFRHASEGPIYRIERRTGPGGRPNVYSVTGMDGYVIHRSHELPAVLRVLERKLIRAVN